VDRKEGAPFEPVIDARPDDLAWPPMRWPPSPELRLTGRVVELAQFDPIADAVPLFQALDYDAVWRHLAGRPGSPADLAASIVAAEVRGRLAWVVRLAREHAGLSAGMVVGTSSFLDTIPADARLEIGWTAYTPAVWSSAVNPDTKLLLLALAFESLGAGRVQLKTDVRNHRSQQAIARLGASYEGTLRRYQRRGDDTVRDTVLFSIVAEEWPAVRERLAARLSEWTDVASEHPHAEHPDAERPDAELPDTEPPLAQEPLLEGEPSEGEVA